MKKWLLIVLVVFFLLVRVFQVTRFRSDRIPITESRASYPVPKEATALPNVNAATSKASSSKLHLKNASLLPQYLRLPFARVPNLNKLSDDDLLKIGALIEKHQVSLGKYERSIAKISTDASGKVSIYIPPFPDVGRAIDLQFYSDVSEELGPSVANSLMTIHPLFSPEQFDRLGEDDHLITVEALPPDGANNYIYRVSYAYSAPPETPSLVPQFGPRSGVDEMKDRQDLISTMGVQIEAFYPDFPTAPPSANRP